MKRFGDKLNRLRKQSGITQKQLSDMLEISESFIWKLEHGQKVPNAAMILNIADIFEVSTDQLASETRNINMWGDFTHPVPQQFI
ncbi:helix-turn-helix transcriptional regulator [Anaerolineales bacterium HSG6]|nr:helix-turn-helix transcriptional regulator [Anaerolineales bacterium HSG6]MDM8530648.1 helix-turn-helix transcriptional regulator [Anaerolineales bacterium HSG25]